MSTLYYAHQYFLTLHFIHPQSQSSVTKTSSRALGSASSQLQLFFSSFVKHSFFFLMSELQREWERQGESFILSFIPHGHDKAKQSQELQPGIPNKWQGPNYLGHLPLLPGTLARNWSKSETTRTCNSSYVECQWCGMAASAFWAAKRAERSTTL